MSHLPATTSSETTPERAAAPETPAERACRNCGAPLAGPWCARCGQHDAPPDPTLRQLAHEAIEELTSFDGRLGATLRALVRPGRLTTEWIAGRRVRYVAPLRLYLTISVLYFFVSALVPSTAGRRGPVWIGTTREPGISTSIGGPGDSARLDPAGHDPARPDSAQSASARTDSAAFDSLPAFVREPLRRGLEDSAGLQRRLTENAPKLFFVLVPLFAAIVALLHRSRRRRYPQHLWFALHVHAFVFAALLVATLAELPGVRAIAMAAGALLGLAIPVYVFLALRAVYGGTLAGTLGRTIALGVLYSIALGIGSALLLVLTLAFL